MTPSRQLDLDHIDNTDHRDHTDHTEVSRSFIGLYLDLITCPRRNMFCFFLPSVGLPSSDIAATHNKDSTVPPAPPAPAAAAAAADSVDGRGGDVGTVAVPSSSAASGEVSKVSVGVREASHEGEGGVGGGGRKQTSFVAKKIPGVEGRWASKSYCPYFMYIE